MWHYYRLIVWLCLFPGFSWATSALAPIGSETAPATLAKWQQDLNAKKQILARLLNDANLAWPEPLYLNALIEQAWSEQALIDAQKKTATHFSFYWIFQLPLVPCDGKGKFS